MPKVVKYASVGLNKGDIKLMNELKDYFGEDLPQVYRRALILLHYITLFKDIDSVAVALKSQSSKIEP
jgi:hypothetical protein